MEISQLSCKKQKFRQLWTNAYHQGWYSAGVHERIPVNQQASMKIGWAYVLINWASDQIG